MKVSELIIALRKMPQDLPVYFDDVFMDGEETPAIEITSVDTIELTNLTDEEQKIDAVLLSNAL